MLPHRGIIAPKSPLVEGVVRPWTSTPGCTRLGLEQFEPVNTKRAHQAAAARPVMLIPLGDLAILEEHRHYLEMRVARLACGMAWAEDPPSRTRHLIGNLEAALLENGEAKTGSSAPLRLPQGFATEGEPRVEGEQAHDRARRQRPPRQEPQRLPLVE